MILFELTENNNTEYIFLKTFADIRLRICAITCNVVFLLLT